MGDAVVTSRPAPSTQEAEASSAWIIEVQTGPHNSFSALNRLFYEDGDGAWIGYNRLLEAFKDKVNRANYVDKTIEVSDDVGEVSFPIDAIQQVRLVNVARWAELLKRGKLLEKTVDAASDTKDAV